jgi:hypothetical protein
MSRNDWIGIGVNLILGGAVYLIGGTAPALVAIFIGFAILVVIRLRGDEDKPEPKISDVLHVAVKLPEQTSQDSGPEIMLSCERMFYESAERLIVQHIGGGSARNIHIGQMSNGNWTADFDPVSYLPIGEKVEVKPRFVPVSPQAIRERDTGSARMTLGYFLLTSVDDGVGPIRVTVCHEDATSRLKIETDFEATYGPRYKLPIQFVDKYFFIQKARRVRKL